MRTFIGAMLVLTLMGTTAKAQQSISRLYTRPPLLDREALDRLHLKQAWATLIPVEGLRDGISSVRITQQAPGNQILIQTRSGLVVALDAATGKTMWRTPVGSAAYRTAAVPLAYNTTSVFVVSDVHLYALDRATGTLQWQFELPNGAIGSPVVDDQSIFLPLGSSRLYSYLLPRLHPLAAAPALSNGGQNTTDLSPPRGPLVAPAGANSIHNSPTSMVNVGHLSGRVEALRPAATGPQPILVSSIPIHVSLHHPPLLTTESILLPGGDGSVATLSKDSLQSHFSFRAEDAITVGVGQHYDFAYLASRDLHLYAIDVLAGRILWRFTSQTPLARQPIVTDKDVYAETSGNGLFRIDRATGDQLWQNRHAVRFLASNPKFVYAYDRYGSFLVLDRARGTLLSTYRQTRDYVVPIANEVTDRIYLAANNGLLICLHDRDYADPFIMKTAKDALTVRAPIQPRAADGSKPKDNEKEKPQDKDDKGDKPDAKPGDDKENNKDK